MKKTSTPANDASASLERPAAEHVSLDRLHEWPKNPDPPQPRDVRGIARSIKRFGFGEPILARLENGEIIAGHARYRAAKLLKLVTVPARFMDLSADEAHVLALADNKLAANRKRDWDGDEVAALLEEMESRDVDIEHGTGFSEDEIDEILGGDAEELEAAVGELGKDLRFQIVVECRDENHQAELLERWEAIGLVCKPIMS